MAAGPIGTHAYAVGVNIHTALRATYANAAAREAESGFYANDVYATVLQIDTGTLWITTEVTAGVPTWQQLTFCPRRNIIPTGVIDGTNVTFTLPEIPANGISIYNGIRLNPGAGNDYVLTGATIVFDVAPTAGVVIADYEV